MNVTIWLDEEELRELGFREEDIRVMMQIKRLKKKMKKETRLVNIIVSVIEVAIPYIIIILSMVIGQ